MSAKLSVYLPDDLAAALKEYKLSPSTVMQEGARDAIAAHKRRLDNIGAGIEEQTITLVNASGDFTEATFVGRWLAWHDSTDGDLGIAITERGTFVFYAFFPSSTNPGTFHTYDSIDEMEDAEQWTGGAGPDSEEFFRDARIALGKKIRLDI